MNKLEGVRKDKKLGVSFEVSNGMRKYVFGDTIDELIDGLEILNDGNFAIDFRYKFPDLTENQLARIDKVVVTGSNDAEKMVCYAIRRRKLSNPKEFEEKLVKLRGYREILKYVQILEVNNLSLLVDCICNGLSTGAMLEMSKVKNVDLLKIKNAIFKRSQDICWISNLIDFIAYHQNESTVITAEDIKNAEQLVIESNNSSYIKKFAEKIKGADKQKLQRIVEELGCADIIYEFAKDVEDADIESLRLAMKKADKCYDFISYYHVEYWKEKFEEKFVPKNVTKKRRFFGRK